VNLCEESWEGSKNGRSEKFDVISEIFHNTCGVTNLDAKNDGINVHDLLIDMGEWHIGEIYIIPELFKLVSQVGLSNLPRDNVDMTEHCSFGFASGS
jgi:hypothetical protein